MAHTSIHPPQSLAGSFAKVGAAYVMAVAVGAVVAGQLGDSSPLVQGAAADLAATLVIFGASRLVNNSSVYDAYWSVAPPFLLVLWAVHPAASGADALRQALMVGALSAWAVRLTWNWARGWRGLHEEDWRYADFRRRLGLGYWPLSLVGLHLFPTVQVFLGLLPAMYAMTSAEPVGALAWGGASVIVGSVVLQGVADEQLRAFVKRAGPSDVLDTGLWARSRHPNYLGEIGVWLGTLLVGLDAGAPWWTAVGFVAVTAMFMGVSIPLMERRQLAKRPGYADVVARVPMLVPRPW